MRELLTAVSLLFLVWIGLEAGYKIGRCVEAHDHAVYIRNIVRNP